MPFCKSMYPSLMELHCVLPTILKSRPPMHFPFLPINVFRILFLVDSCEQAVRVETFPNARFVEIIDSN